ncbi:MAG TPA: hypothetical protein VHV30_12770 [Polyangiaceae bacterium]|nr:hypothetical protein [Polyangiaceae bacterium]
MTACATAAPGGGRSAVEAARAAQADEAQRVASFDRQEARAMSWIAAADPRLAARERAGGAGGAPDPEVLKQIGMEAVFAEDANATIHDGSLDLFAFRARAHALDQAAEGVSGATDALPETAPDEASVTRPRLERELLGRLIDEERARAAEEAKLGDAAGDLVRAIVGTWTPPAAAEEWAVRDEWVGKHLLEIRDSLRSSSRSAGPRSGPLDLDIALYPLERLLAPLTFPRGSAAIAALRVGIDEDMRIVPALVVPERVVREAKVHLGVTLDSASLPGRFDQTAARLTELASAALAASGSARPAVEARARELLLVEHPCPPVAGTRVRSMAPPPERAAICGALDALADDKLPAAGLVALHDDLLIADAAFTTSPPPRTVLLSHPDDDTVDALRRAARERPIPAIGVALAAELLYGTEGTDARLHAWRALGEAPLDVVARELATAR